MKKVIVICGATATGKSEYAFQFAKKLNTEIISFDGVQVYKKLNIGTAKPSAAQLESVKHHLIDEIEPDKTFTAGDFRKTAFKILEQIFKKNATAILVGGTGFYLRSLLSGMYESVVVSSEIKERLNIEAHKLGYEKLFEELSIHDPEYAGQIHKNDKYRIMRGLELVRSGVKPSSLREQFSKASFPYELIQIGLRRKKDTLKDAIELRTQKMINSGLIEETESLIKSYPDGLRPLMSVGYKETGNYIGGLISKTQLHDEIVRNTMALAKRQSTWFKRDKSIQWFDPDLQGAEIEEFLNQCSHFSPLLN